MCGINGVFGVEKLSDVQGLVQRMNDALKHRGPDNDGMYTDDLVALGHRRLSIIDTSAEANQPFFNADKNIVLIINGELYNYLELKEELSEYAFSTQSDTEVIVAAYEKWGISCLQKFNGMFALAIWDKRTNDFFLARDRMGIKPLYVARKGAHVIFSSEIRALLSSELVDRKLDTESLWDYFRYGTVHAPQTMIEGVEMILPGHYLKITDNEVSAVQYWDITERYSTLAGNLGQGEIESEVSRLLKQSVALRMRADVPFGAFLSGGIDSSAIVGLMSEISSHPVKTFSVTFNEQNFSEAPFSRMVAERFGTDHTEINLTATDFLNQIPDALRAMDHPSFDGPNTYVVSKVTREAGVTMALSGLGGDELFAGYDIFKRMSQFQNYRWLTSFPKGARNIATGLLKAVRPGVGSEKIKEILSNDYLDFEYVYPVNRKILFDKQIQSLLKSAPGANLMITKLSQSIGYGHPGFDLPLLSKVSHAEMSTYMQNVLLRDTDQMSMAHALEVRVPFLDHHLVEFIMGVNDKIKQPITPKRLLTQSLQNLLPEEVINRPKMGFTLPWQEWMKSEMRELCEEKILQLGKREQFSEEGLKSLWKQFLNNKISWARVWHLVVLEFWMENHGIS